MATWRCWLLIGLGILALPHVAAAAFLDAVLAEAEGETITASEIGLARALALFELQPTSAPIQPSELETLVDGRILEREALRLQIQPSPEELQAAWRSAADRAGGETALAAWLARIGVSQEWVRRLVDGDLRRRQFIQLRFRAFALVGPAELQAALGPGPHADAEREAVEARLTRDAAEQALRAWLRDARSRAGVRPVTGALPAPCPIPLP